MTINLNQELKSAIPGDIFICSSGLKLTYVETRSPDYSFPYLLKTMPVNKMDPDVYVAYNLDGISCFTPGSTWASSCELSHKVMETEETVPFKLNSLYLRNDGKVVRIVKEHAEDYKVSNGVDRISELTLEGSDGYFYSYKDGRAYTHGTNYEMFLVAEVNCDPRTTSQDLDRALAKLINVNPR